MPQYNRAELGRMATKSGYVRDTFEKVLRLKEILKFLNEDKFLREQIRLINHLTPQLLTHLISTKSEEIYFQCLIRKIISSWKRERRLRRITY